MGKALGWLGLAWLGKKLVMRSYHFRGELIPLVLLNALASRPLPRYCPDVGGWQSRRDRQHGGWSDKCNLDVLHILSGQATATRRW